MKNECEHITIDYVIDGYTKHAQCCEETGCYTSASEFRQVAAWLRELKRYRENEKPFKAFEAIKDYCKNNRSCEGCPLHHGAEGAFCVTYPERWRIKKEGE